MSERTSRSTSPFTVIPIDGVRSPSRAGSPNNLKVRRASAPPNSPVNGSPIRRLVVSPRGTPEHDALLEKVSAISPPSSPRISRKPRRDSLSFREVFTPKPTQRDALAIKKTLAQFLVQRDTLEGSGYHTIHDACQLLDEAIATLAEEVTLHERVSDIGRALCIALAEGSIFISTLDRCVEATRRPIDAHKIRVTAADLTTGDLTQLAKKLLASAPLDPSISGKIHLLGDQYHLSPIQLAEFAAMLGVQRAGNQFTVHFTEEIGKLKVSCVDRSTSVEIEATIDIDIKTRMDRWWEALRKQCWEAKIPQARRMNAGLCKTIQTVEELGITIDSALLRYRGTENDAATWPTFYTLVAQWWDLVSQIDQVDDDLLNIHYAKEIHVSRRLPSELLPTQLPISSPRLCLDCGTAKLAELTHTYAQNRPVQRKSRCPLYMPIEWCTKLVARIAPDLPPDSAQIFYSSKKHWFRIFATPDHLSLLFPDQTGPINHQRSYRGLTAAGRPTLHIEYL